MSNNALKTTDLYTFVVYNKKGRMDVINGTVANVVYANSGYKIALKMEGIDYTSSYRSEVLWDFGDGTTKKGRVVEHNYSRPGHYTISATLFDANKESCKVSNTINVIVKELLPTVIKFDVPSVKNEIKCSKIEKIARLECMVSNLTDAPLEVKVKRIYDKLSLTPEESRGKSYFDVKNTLNFHIDKYWTTLKTNQDLYYNCDQIYSSDLTPSETFTPTYTALYYRLVKTTSGNLGLKFYQVLPYKNIDDNLTTITVLDPNADIIEGESYKTYRVENVYTIENLPQDAVYCGIRGFVDVFYKSDFLGEDNTFSIFYDYDAGDITREMYSGGNYMNVLPLGLTVKTVSNDITASNLKFVASGNYFANDKISDIKISDTSTSVFIDPYFEGSLYNGLDVNCIVFPVYHYTDEDDVKQEDNSYYIPKDFITSISKVQCLSDGNGKYGEPSVDGAYENVLSPSEKDVRLPWMCKIPFILNNYIDIDIVVKVTDDEKTSKEQSIRICQKPLRSIKDLVIPGEKVTEVNINELLDTYMSHPMFLDTPNTRDFFKIYISAFVDKVQTESDNFIDNIANVKTCYLTHLISQLKMMGEEVVEYEHSRLEGINDLKKFSRLLSMNHSDLIGHTTKTEWDIEASNEFKGENVGKKIGIRDKITLCVPQKPENTEDGVAMGEYYAKFAKITHINDEAVDYTDIIIREKHSNKTIIMNFRDCLNEILASKQRNTDKYVISLEDYKESWGWNLLLTEGYSAICNKIQFYNERKAEHESLLNNDLKDYERDEIKQKIQRYEEEIEILENRRRDAITGYYDFYVLNDTRSIIRQGNFIADEYLTDEIADADEWGRQWGITHDVLMKILLTNAKLVTREDIKPDRGYYYKDIWETSVINLDANLSSIKETYYVEGDEITSSALEDFMTDSYTNDSIDICIKSVNTEDTYEINSSKYKTSGNIRVHGKVFSEGVNKLEISLQDCLIDGRDRFKLRDEDDSSVEIFVEGRTIYDFTCDENGNIIITNDCIVKELNITDAVGGDTTKINDDLSKVIIKISGDIDNPSIQVNALVIYDPTIIKDEFTNSFTIKGGGKKESENKTEKFIDSLMYSSDNEIDTEFSKQIDFKFNVGIETSIYGVGESRGAIKLGIISFNGGKQTDEIYFRDYEKVFLDFYINNDGKIVKPDGQATDENNYITTGKLYLKGKFDNIYSEEHFDGKYIMSENSWIEVRLWGSQKTANWDIKCGTDDEEDIFKFYYEYKAIDVVYEYGNSKIIEDTNTFAVNLYTSGEIKNATKNEDGTYSLPAHINDVNIKLTRISDGVYRLAMTGQYETDVAYYEGNTTDVWQTVKPINVITDVAIDKFGNICSYLPGEGDEVIKIFNTEFYAFEQGESLDLINEKTFNIKFNIEGNVINDNKLIINRSYYEDKTPTGVFVKLFNEVKIPEDFDFSCLDEHGLTVAFKFINFDGSDFEKIVTKSMEYAAEPRLKLIFSKGEDVHFEYFTDAIKDCKVWVSPTGKTELISRNRVKVKNGINPIIHTFERENIIHPDSATTYYDISDETVTFDKFEIDKDFVLQVFELTLVTKNLIFYNEYKEQLWSNTIDSLINENTYQAECDITISGQCYTPDINGEVLHAFITVTPKVKIEVNNKVLVWYLKENDERMPIDCFISRTETGSISISGFNFDQTYTYYDVDEEGEDEDGDTNYEVRVYIPELISTIANGRSVLKAKNAIIDLEIVERNMVKSFDDLLWSESNNDISGNFDLMLNGKVSEDNKSTLLTVSITDPTLTIHGISVPQENIKLSIKENEDDLNKIYLDGGLRGQGTIVINGSCSLNGRFCSIEKEIVITVDGSRVTLDEKEPLIIYRDDRYDITTTDVKFDDYDKAVTGGLVFSGEGIKDEVFNGSINIVSPKIYGVLLEPVKLIVDGKDYSLIKSSVNENHYSWDFYTTDVKINSTDESTGKVHEIAKPTNLTLEFEKNDMSFTETFGFFRNTNNDDKIGETRDVFDINLSDLNNVIEYPTLKNEIDCEYSIKDVTNYKRFNIIESPNTYENAEYDISGEFKSASLIPGDSRFNNHYGYIATTAKFDDLSINGVPINVQNKTYPLIFNDEGNLNPTNFDMQFFDDSKQYQVNAHLYATGNASINGDVDYYIGDFKFSINPKYIKISSETDQIANDEKNEHNISSDQKFDATLQFYGALAKDSYVSLDLGESERTLINGLPVLSKTDEGFIVSVDKNGSISEVTKEFIISDKLGVVGISGDATISGNITTGVNYTVSNLYVHADELNTTTRLIKPESLNNEVIESEFQVSPVNDGGSYPTNGRIGTNPTVNITNKNEIIVNGITLTTNDTSFQNNPKWSVSISEDGLVSSTGNTSCIFKSIGDAIILKATFSIDGDYSIDKTLYATTTIGFNDGSTTIFNKVQHEDITVTPGDNLTLEDVFIVLGKYIEFNLNGSATVNGIILNLTNTSTTVNMTGYDVDDYAVRYEKKVGDTLIASLDYTLQIDGELTYNETTKKFEGLEGELVDEQRYVLLVPSASYEFGNGVDEENLTGSFEFEPNVIEFKNGDITFALNNSVKYDDTDLSLNSPISFDINCNFNNPSFDGSITELDKTFELTDENETINVMGTVSLAGNVITGMTIGVQITSIEVTIDYEDFAGYANDGEYLMARLKKLRNGDNLFRNQSLESFNATMPRLTTAQNMFKGCSNLTRFASNMPKLTDGSNMFKGCSNLTTFSGMMPNLSKATNMFKDAKLNKQSVKNIINQLYNGNGISENDVEIITIGVNATEGQDNDFMTYLNKNEHITNVSGQKWKLKINWKQ